GSGGCRSRTPAPAAGTRDPPLSATSSAHVYASLIYGALVRFPAGPEIRAAGDARILPDVAEKWAWTNPTAELKPEDQSRYATMTFLGKFDKMAMGPFGAGVTEIDELPYETFFSASPSYLPMWPRYITYPSYVKGFRNHDGASLGSGLLSTQFAR